jgi:hypothetical protein
MRVGPPALLSWLGALALVTFTSLASADADEARRRAGESYRGAQAAFKRRDFAAAAAAYEAAAGFVPHPAALLAAADAWERAGEPDRAAEDCDRALALPGLAAAEQKDSVHYQRDAADCVARLGPRVGTVDLTGTSTTAVQIDGGAQDILPKTRRLRSGRHTLVVTNLTTSETRTNELVIAAGERLRVDFEPPAPASDPSPDSFPAPARASPSSVLTVPERREASAPAPSGLTWTALGVGAAGAVASGILTIVLVHSRNSYEAAPTQAGRDDFYRKVVWLDVGLAITVASLVTGAVLWLAAPTHRGG